jgi:hypothetical protein
VTTKTCQEAQRVASRGSTKPQHTIKPSKIRDAPLY